MGPLLHSIIKSSFCHSSSFIIFFLFTICNIYDFHTTALRGCRFRVRSISRSLLRRCSQLSTVLQPPSNRCSWNEIYFKRRQNGSHQTTLDVQFSPKNGNVSSAKLTTAIIGIFGNNRYNKNAEIGPQAMSDNSPSAGRRNEKNPTASNIKQQSNFNHTSLMNPPPCAFAFALVCRGGM